MSEVASRERPWDFHTARLRAHDAARVQKGAEENLRNATRGHAEAERAYRLALAQKITELRADGHPALLTQDLARGDQHVAGLRYQRDVADGVREAASQAAWRAAADRRDLHALLTWSMRADLREDPELGPPTSVIGGRRAA